MRYVDFYDFNFSQIQMFLTLADTLSYTKTAEIFGVTQPTISRNIYKLEVSLGLQLFIRDTSKVILTPAGKSLYEDMVKLVHGITAAFQKAGTIQTGKKDVVIVAASSFWDPTAWLYPSIDYFHEKHPNIDVELICPKAKEGQSKLMNYECDVVLNTEYEEKFYADKPEMVNQVIIRAPFAVTMLKSNPLSSRKSVSLEDIKSLKLLMPGENVAPSFVDAVLSMYRKAGIKPLVDSYVNSADELYYRLRTNEEVYIADKYSRDRLDSRMVLVDLENSRNDIFLKYRRDDMPDAGSLLFVNAIREWLEKNLN